MTPHQWLDRLITALTVATLMFVLYQTGHTVGYQTGYDKGMTVGERHIDRCERKLSECRASLPDDDETDPAHHCADGGDKL